MSRQLDDVLCRALDGVRTVALLDFPNHNNAGDNAIWLGEKTWLERNGIRVAYQCDRHSFSAEALEASIPAGGTVLLHGGGNLGDVWPAHQEFREAVIARLREHRIIQLPQSVRFQSQEVTARCRRAFNDHPDLTVLVRDEVGLRFVQSHIDERAILCPDMAFALGSLERPSAPDRPIVWLARTDHESATPDIAARADVAPVDWLVGEPGRPVYTASFRATVRCRGLVARAFASSPLLREIAGPPFGRIFDHLARARTARGARILSRGHVVVSDRLHAHIMCLLLDIPHVLLDNSYGKLRNYYAAFTSESPLTHWAESVEEAIDLARELASDESRRGAKG